MDQDEIKDDCERQIWDIYFENRNEVMRPREAIITFVDEDSYLEAQNFDMEGVKENQIVPLSLKNSEA